LAIISVNGATAMTTRSSRTTSRGLRTTHPSNSRSVVISCHSLVVSCHWWSRVTDVPVMRDGSVQATFWMS